MYHVVAWLFFVQIYPNVCQDGIVFRDEMFEVGSMCLNPTGPGVCTFAENCGITLTEMFHRQPTICYFHLNRIPVICCPASRVIQRIDKTPPKKTTTSSYIPTTPSDIPSPSTEVPIIPSEAPITTSSKPTTVTDLTEPPELPPMPSKLPPIPPKLPQMPPNPDPTISSSDSSVFNEDPHLVSNIPSISNTDSNIPNDDSNILNNTPIILQNGTSLQFETPTILNTDYDLMDKDPDISTSFPTLSSNDPTVLNNATTPSTIGSILPSEIDDISSNDTLNSIGDPNLVSNDRPLNVPNLLFEDPVILSTASTAPNNDSNSSDNDPLMIGFPIPSLSETDSNLSGTMTNPLNNGSGVSDDPSALSNNDSNPSINGLPLLFEEPVILSNISSSSTSSTNQSDFPIRSSEDSATTSEILESPDSPISINTNSSTLQDDSPAFPTLIPVLTNVALESSSNTTETLASGSLRVSAIKCREYTQNYTSQTITESQMSNFNTDVIGGVSSSPGEFPHMAALGYEDADDADIVYFFCGGSLISERYILTAAHCFLRNSAEFARLGEYDITSAADNNNVADFDIANVITHPQYRSSSVYNDIALVLLDTDVILEQFIRPACLNYQEDTSSFELVATGWGHNTFGGEETPLLQKVKLAIFPTELCSIHYATEPTLRDGILDSQICAGSNSALRDPCHGDSGGPLSYHMKDSNTSNNNYYIVGITSYGKECGTKVPAIYTRVSSYLDWIEEIVWNENTFNENNTK
ncbi:serine proteinase stubble-like [Phlebotomus papatasi]|uniref:serine proteinase stubble-like n=1 Tax=Phlebotomus papatasi TaxID=29031 RepID=UPI0024846680|nr:serine proteinase stubble-like [Phlebotomus papatasi]